LCGEVRGGGVNHESRSWYVILFCNSINLNDLLINIKFVCMFNHNLWTFWLIDLKFWLGNLVEDTGWLGNSFIYIVKAKLGSQAIWFIIAKINAILKYFNWMVNKYFWKYCFVQIPVFALPYFSNIFSNTAPIRLHKQMQK